MTYRADISSQPLTPSAPDVSGAVGAITSQAGIAKTIFGGVEAGYESYKQGKLKTALEEAQGLQLSELQQSQKEIKATEDVKLAQSLAGPPTPEGKEIPFQAEIEKAADRLSQIKAAGGFNRESDYYTRVTNLVDKYAAMLPGSREEIRAVVAKGSGLEGADLWAQQQFIKQMFSPKEQKLQKDEAAQKAQQMQLDRVVALGVDPVEALRLQRSQDPSDMELWSNYEKTATQLATLKVQSEAAKQRAESLAQTNTMNAEVNGQAFRQAGLMAAGERANAVYGQSQKELQILLGKFNQNQWTQQDDQQIGVIASRILAEAEKAFVESRQAFNSSLPVSIPAEVRKEQLARFDEDVKNFKERINVSDVGQLRELSRAFMTSKDKNLDSILKLAQANSYFTQNMLDAPDMRTALGVDEIVDGKLSPEWKIIQDTKPAVLPFLRQQREIIKAGLSAVRTAQVLDALPVSVAVRNGQETPNATVFPSNATKEDKKAAIELTAISAVERAFAISSQAVAQTWQNTPLQQRPAQMLASSFAENTKDVNICSTALCNAAQGNSVVTIKSNQAAFKGFYSKITPVQQNAMKAAISFEVEQSLNAAMQGLKDVNKEFGVNLQFGVDKNSKTFGIVPPPRDRFFDPRLPQDMQYASSLKTNQPISTQIRMGVDVPAAFKKYYPGLMVKPEYVKEVTELGNAAAKWNNTYLSRVAGSFTSQSIVNNQDEFAIAQEFMRSVRDNKRIPSFYDFSAPSAAEDGGGVAAVQEKPSQKQEVKQTKSLAATPEELDRVSIIQNELASTEAKIQTAKKRLERARAANDAEDVADYERQLTLFAESTTALNRELKTLQKGR